MYSSLHATSKIPERQRHELSVSVRSGLRNERYAVGFLLFSQPALGLLLEKERGAGGAVWLRLICAVTSPGRRLGLQSSERENNHFALSVWRRALQTLLLPFTHLTAGTTFCFSSWGQRSQRGNSSPLTLTLACSHVVLSSQTLHELKL